jgi:uncharacterized protein (TIGR01777 family)
MRGRIILAGGSGFLGQALSAHLTANGYQTIVLSRSRQPREGFVHWDGTSLGDWSSQLDGAQAIVNLTGRSVDCRYTQGNRREIVASRVDSVRVLAEAVRQCDAPPEVWIQAASLAIYGDAGSRICDDDAPHGSGFSVDVCEKWEHELDRQDLGLMRRVVLRIGFALAAGGGALGRLATLTRWFLGGAVGNGRQYISWVHIQDVNRLFAWCLENDHARGVYNATGRSPVTNREFMAALRRALHRPWSPRTPAMAVRLGAYLMGTEAELALTGRRCMPTRLKDEGFDFRYTDLDASLREIFAPHASAG